MIDMVRHNPANAVAIILYYGATLFQPGVASDIFGNDRWVAAGHPGTG